MGEWRINSLFDMIDSLLDEWRGVKGSEYACALAKADTDLIGYCT
jgi:hypothetical protein